LQKVLAILFLKIHLDAFFSQAMMTLAYRSSKDNFCLLGLAACSMFMFGLSSLQI
jgi:hypothetical protein